MKDKVFRGLKACKDFLCGECPYQNLDSKDYPIRCIHTLIVDLDKVCKELNIENHSEIKGE